MPDRNEATQTIVEPQAMPAATAAPGKATALQKLFPPAASLMIVGGLGYLAYYMDRAVMSGQLTGMPYALLTLMFAAIFAVHYFIFREG